MRSDEIRKHSMLQSSSESSITRQVVGDPLQRHVSPKPLLLMLVVALFSSHVHTVECFTLPPLTPSAIISATAALRKDYSIPTISTNSYSISRHKWQRFGMHNEEDDYDDEASSTNTAREEDTVEAYSSIDDSNEEDDDEQPIKKRQLSLAELEDYEEARQAALELEELQGTSSSQSMLTSVTPTAIVGASAASSSSSSPTSSTISIPSSSVMSFDYDSDNTSYGTNTINDINYRPQTATYLPNTPQQEIALAQKRDILQNTRLNEMFAEEDAVAANRQARIRALMDEDDKIWKAERRKRLLGKYASVESWEEVERLMEEDRRKEAKGMFVYVCLFVCLFSSIRYPLILTFCTCA